MHTMKGNEPNLGVPQQEQQAWQGGGLDSWGRGEWKGEVLAGRLELWSRGQRSLSGAGGPSCVEDRDDARWE